MKILCFGDSNTYGYDPRSFLGSQYPPQYRWVDILGKKLFSQIINAGENGRRIPVRKNDRDHFRKLLAEQTPIDLLIIMLGTNDLLQGTSPETAAKQMESFCQDIDLERSRILLIGPPPMQRGGWVSMQELTLASISLNSAYKTRAEALGVDFLDAGNWNIPMAFDGVHFTEEGHKVFAEELANYLNKGVLFNGSQNEST